MFTYIFVFTHAFYDALVKTVVLILDQNLFTTSLILVLVPVPYVRISSTPSVMSAIVVFYYRVSEQKLGCATIVLFLDESTEKLPVLKRKSIQHSW